MNNHSKLSNLFSTHDAILFLAGIVIFGLLIIKSLLVNQ